MPWPWSSRSFGGGVNLPEDLLADILVRLPVKSLLHLKCVRKYWYALIESPNFISNHHNHNHAMLLVLRFVRRRDIVRDPAPIVLPIGSFVILMAMIFVPILVSIATLLWLISLATMGFSLTPIPIASLQSLISATINFMATLLPITPTLTPSADISDDEFYADTNFNAVGTDSNSEENWDTKCNSNTNSVIYTLPDEDEDHHKELHGCVP